MQRATRIALAVLLAVISFSMFFVTNTNSVSAGNSETPANKTFFAEEQVTENNQKKLIEKQPAQTVDHSLERDNLNRRLQFINDSNRIGYVYLLADTGQVISEYVIKGKPSSLNSYITQMEQIRCKYDASGSDKGCAAVQSPDLDGSYGSNPDGIFFFTTNNNYVEWSGRYIYSSERLSINTPVSLTRSIE